MSQRSPGGTGGGTPVTGTTVTATSQFLAADGTALAPGYAWTSAPSTGFYLNSGQIKVSFANSNTLTIGSTFITGVVAGAVDNGSASTGWKRLYIDFTNTGTVGSVTINKAAGRVNLAAAGTTLTLTNSLITAASKVFLQMASAPGNAVAVSWVSVPAAGSVVITATPAVTNQTAIDFFVVNTD